MVLMDASERAAAEGAVKQAVRRQVPAGRGEVVDALAEGLHSRFAHYTGVYIYLLEGDMLVLRAFRGRPTEHVRIPVGEGICGRAARVRQTVTVDDVSADPDYIACSLETRSEIVVPIILADRVLGEIDIDSDVASAFSPADRAFLEDLARLVAPHLG